MDVRTVRRDGRTRRVRLGLTAAALVAAVATVATVTASVAVPTPARAASDDPPTLHARTVRTYPAFDADQGVAVDGRYFYSVDNYSITKHDKRTGRALRQWYGGEDGPVIHLDGAMTWRGRIYAPHSNYSDSPMTSSIEVWDPRTMRHVGTHSFGIDRGSFTWIDRHDGAWWGTFANYDKIPDGQTEPYGRTENTKLVRMNDRFQVTDSWTFPAALIDSFRPMSNSGGSWGPDGRLYISGHDASAVYVLELPGAGSVMRWVATVKVDAIEGQGIAWDRSGGKHPLLWGISRDSKHVVSLDVPLQHGRPRTPVVGHVYGPGHFVRPTS